MAKRRRPTGRAAASKSTPKRRAATFKKTATKKSAAKKPAPKKRAAKKTATKRKAPAPRAHRAAHAPVVNIREAYAKAVALYERGLKALQRKNYDRAAATFRQVLEEFPDERELHERARLYLNVCEREPASKTKAPRSVDERILAATVALNRREVDHALSLLRNSASSHPKHDHVQYMMALAHALKGDADTASVHLEKAIALNPDNRLQSQQEPDFDSIRGAQPFLDALKT